MNSVPKELSYGLLRTIADQTRSEAKINGHPTFDQIDLVWKGWARSVQFIRTCIEQLNSNSISHQYADLTSDSSEPPCYEELFVMRHRAVSFVDRLRIDPAMLFTFKPEFGHSELRPHQSNQVLDLNIPAANVPTADIADLITRHQLAGDRPSAITWQL